MKKFTRIIWVFITLGALAAASIPADAGAYLYSGKRKRVNVGIVVVQGASQPLGVGASGGIGDMFYQLDGLTGLKPAGWTLENPLAPMDPTTGLCASKDNPLYWMVNLNSVRDLSMMSLLYLPANGTVNLDDQDREKLRQFVDGGGVLWIDNAVTGSNPLVFSTTQPFFIQDVSFATTSGYDVAANRHHPLLTVPFWLTDGEIANIGNKWGQYYINPGYSASSTGWDAFNDQPVNFDILLPIVNVVSTGLNSEKPSMAANTYGSGRIVATSTFAGRGCFLNYPFNLPSIKFAYNAISWASSWTHLRKNPRHSGSSIDTVGGTKLVNNWSLSGPGIVPSADTETAPVIYKNVVFYTAGNKVFAADLVPQEDLDQDGNPDDGLPNSANVTLGLDNKGQDVIWCFTPPTGGGGGTLSAPTIVTVQSPKDPAKTADAVLVSSTNGDVYMLNAFPIKTGTVSTLDTDTSLLIPVWQAGPGNKAYPPLYVNGWMYTVTGDGRLRAYNPSLEEWASVNNKPASSKWAVPSENTTSTSTSTPKSGPSFGFMKNESSGAIVGMVYWFTGPFSGSVTDQEQNDFVCAVPVFVSNDRLRFKETTADRMSVECQITYNSGFISSTPPPRVWMKLMDGTVVNADPDDVLPNRGIIGGVIDTTTVNLGSLVATFHQAIPSDAMIYASYAMDYASQNTLAIAASIRMRIALQPSSNTANLVPATAIAGSPALGPNAMIYLNGTRTNAPGSVYGVMNDGSSQVTRWHYILHSGDTTVPGTSSSEAIPAVIFDKQNPNDTSTWSPMLNAQPFSSPAYAGDKVFVTVTGAGGGPKGALLCFKANPNFVVNITENAGYGSNGQANRHPKKLINPATGREMMVKVWQPNMLSTGVTAITANPLIEAVPVPKDMIDYQRGTITFDNFDRIKLRGAGATFMQTNTLTPSLPVWVFLDNIEVPIDWSTWPPSAVQYPLAAGGSRSVDHDSVDLSGWNNLLWYYVVPPYNGSPCSGVHSSPIVIGNTVYFVTDDGILYSLNSETGETACAPTSSTPIWQEKIGNGSLTTGTNVSPAGANGVLLVPGPDGVYAYANTTTLVADNSRICELDGSGELSWAVDSIQVPVMIPPSVNDAVTSKASPINKPARARYIGGNAILVANTGANQVCKIDKSGAVGVENLNNATHYLRWVYDKFADPKHLLSTGEPTQLSSPTDAILWQETEPVGNTNIQVVHCLIADSGNHRIVDLIYRIDGNNLLNGTQDPNTGFYLPELNWVTKSESMNRKFIFNSMQLIPNPNNGDTDIWASVSNYRTGNAPVSDKGLGGAIVQVKYRIQGSGGVHWIYYDETANKDSGDIISACDRVDWMMMGGVVPLASPRSFQVVYRPTSDPSKMATCLLVCDNYGVYEIDLSGPNVVRSLVNIGNFSDSASGNDVCYQNLVRSFTDDSGTVTVGGIAVPFEPASVQEMPNGNWLITNKYAGSSTDSSKAFHGEVFEYNPGQSDSVDDPALVWCSPALLGVPNDYRQNMKNGAILQQPQSAARQF